MFYFRQLMQKLYWSIIGIWIVVVRKKRWGLRSEDLIMINNYNILLMFTYMFLAAAVLHTADLPLSLLLMIYLLWMLVLLLRWVCFSLVLNAINISLKKISFIGYCCWCNVPRYFSEISFKWQLNPVHKIIHIVIIKILHYIVQYGYVNVRLFNSH